MNKNSLLIIFLVILLAGLFLGIFIYSLSPGSVSNKSDELSVNLSPSPSMTPSAISGPPLLNLKPDTKYEAELNTTSGKITIDLFTDKTPITSNNFIYLSQKGFYNNTIFHRVIKGFMIQGGDPIGNGTGGPGYKFNDEPFTGEYTRGAVAMANAGPNTNGSQFFIMHQTYNLPKNYVIFGQVISGLDVVDKIAEAPVTVSNSGENSTPVNPVKILTVVITEKKSVSTSSAINP